MDTDKVLVNADAASRGAAMALADKSAPETKARERLRADRSTGGLSWFGLPPAGERGKHARPDATYRGARRNAAHDAKWPGRARPMGIYGGLTGGGRQVRA